MVANHTSRVAHLPAREVHLRLRRALADLENAQRNAVLWFSEVVRRKLYRDLGYSSIYQYAELELGFKKSKTAQFLRLCESLKELPELRRSVARGELSWTKAREVAKVATSDTESNWIQEAKRVPNRELERQVTEKKRQARVGVSGRAQVTLEMGSGEKKGFAVSEEGIGSMLGTTPDCSGPGDGMADVAAPVDVHVRMTPEQYARYQTLMEALRKGRVKRKAELLLAGLEQLVLGAQEPFVNETSSENDAGVETGNERTETGNATDGADDERGRTGSPSGHSVPRKFTREGIAESWGDKRKSASKVYNPA